MKKVYNSPCWVTATHNIKAVRKGKLMDTAFSIIAIILQILQVVDFIASIIARFSGTSAE